jgi:CO/xanthine dehydrogenase FAD-binding subunit
MKPPKFDYFAPDSIASALALFTEHGDDARYLSGGQSLVPMMN